MEQNSIKKLSSYLFHNLIEKNNFFICLHFYNFTHIYLQATVFIIFYKTFIVFLQKVVLNSYKNIGKIPLFIEIYTINPRWGKNYNNN